jgi:long-subunit fatty acid transport protein
MLGTVRLLVPTLLCVLAAPAPARGQDLESAPCGAAGLALAGACAVGAPSPASVWANPALLAVSPANVSAALWMQTGEHTVTRTDMVGEARTGSRDAAGVQLSPAVAVAVPLWKRRLWLAAGYHQGLVAESFYPPPRGVTGGSAAPRDDPARHLGTELSLVHHRFGLGLAFRWRMLSVGATVELGHLRMKHRRSLWAGMKGDESKLLFEDPDLDVDARLEGHDTLDVGGLLGIWARPLAFLELGLALRLPVWTTLDARLTLSPGAGAPFGYVGWSATGGPAPVALRLPLSLQGGLALRWRWLRVALELAWARWSAADDPQAAPESAALVLRLASGASETWPLLDLPLGIRLRDRISGHLGLEGTFWSGTLTLRLGYAYHHGASDPAAPAAVLLDLDRHVLGGGAELALGWVRMAVAVSHSFRATLDTGDQGARLHNPLDPSMTKVVGQGLFSSTRTRVVLELGAAW